LTNPGLERVYLDANSFIGMVEGTGPRTDRLMPLFDRIAEGRLVGITSELTAAEVLVHPLRRGDDETAEAYRDILSPRWPIATLGIDLATLEVAAATRAKFPRLKLPDAIHIATCVRADCGIFVSADRELPLPAAVRLVNPDDPLDVDRFLTALP